MAKSTGARKAIWKYSRNKFQTFKITIAVTAMVMRIEVLRRLIGTALCRGVMRVMCLPPTFDHRFYSVTNAHHLCTQSGGRDGGNTGKCQYGDWADRKTYWYVVSLVCWSHHRAMMALSSCVYEG